MSSHTCAANAAKSDRLYEPFIPLSTARTRSASVAVGVDPVENTINTAAMGSAAATAPATRSPGRALMGMSSRSPMTARADARRAARKKHRLERNRLNLDDVGHRDKHFAQ